MISRPRSQTNQRNAQTQFYDRKQLLSLVFQERFVPKLGTDVGTVRKGGYFIDTPEIHFEPRPLCFEGPSSEKLDPLPGSNNV